MATQLQTASRSVATARWCVLCVPSPGHAALCPVLTWLPSRSQYIHLNATLTRDNADLAHLLTEQGIAVRAGHHCAMPLLKQMGLSGAIRVSLALYNDSDDLERFFEALDQALDMLR